MTAAFFLTFTAALAQAQLTTETKDALFLLRDVRLLAGPVQRQQKTIELDDVGKAGFYDVDIPLAADLFTGKTKITVTLQAHPGNSAGGIFDLRLLNDSLK